MNPEADLAGRTLAHYRLIERIGSGGMGVVYRAEDTHLDRIVAIKVLPADAVADPDRRRRFVQEAKAASALNHPNIIHVYDIGSADGIDFIAMEYVSGTTLEQLIGCQGLPLADVLKCAAQVAGALAAAHAVGIVHRDVKPANVMVTEKGLVKVLDFGLAKLMERDGGLGSATTLARPALTEQGTIVGTVAYMSPEQAEGKTIDARSDIFSFGSVLYEMVTGRRAFAGDSTVGTLAAILRQEPAPIEGIPPELAQIIARCHRKEPDRRIQHMDDVAIALEEVRDAARATRSQTSASPGAPGTGAGPESRPWWRWPAAALLCALLIATALVVGNVGGLRDLLTGSAGPAPIRSIAVLPLENLSGNPEQEYFVDGMTDAITTELGKVSGFDKVSAWQSMKVYKKTTKSLGEIAREVDVDALVQGVVLREGNRVRISSKLFRISPEKQLWANSYDRELREVLSLQSEVAQAVAREVGVSIAGRQVGASAAAMSVNPDAYDYYLRGSHYLEQRSDQASLRISVQMLERAVALDPGFSLAYAKLAYAHVYLWMNYYDRTEARRDAARDAARKALQLQPDSAVALWAMGCVYYRGYLDYARALQELDAAQQLNPNDSHVEETIAGVKRRQGRFDDAVAHYEKATSLSPNFATHFFDLAVTYSLLRRYGDADRPFQRALSLDPQAQFFARRAWFALLSGRPDLARATLVEARDKSLSYVLLPYYWVQLERYAGRSDAALSALASETAEAFEWQWFYVPKALLQADALASTGQPDAADRAYDAARQLLEDKLRAQPDDDRYYGSLGAAFAGLGRRKEAVEAGKKGMELCPPGKEAWRATFRMTDMARIYVMVGQPGDAITQLDYLLSVPGEISIYALQNDPAWAPLKASSGFQDLIRKYGR
jgi:serine/threonine protein kinase/tetratricopeptide (TPR) repeat protein